MAFQPVFDLGSGAVFGHEALVRARLGERLIGAGELLSAAPAHGGLHLFDSRARQVAIRQGAALTTDPEQGGGHLLINFMPGVVYDPEVCLSTTFAACRESGVDPARLIFEVVETESVPDLPVLRTVLDRYRREGMKVALDDLGAGHSSLVYLEALRPDIVKLDKSLLLGLTLDDPRVKLVDASDPLRPPARRAGGGRGPGNRRPRWPWPPSWEPIWGRATAWATRFRARSGDGSPAGQLIQEPDQFPDAGRLPGHAAVTITLPA